MIRTRTQSTPRHHRTYSGAGTFTCREDFDLIDRVIAERRRRERNQWRNG